MFKKLLILPDLEPEEEKLEIIDSKLEEGH
jgi:hypothetical protein